jgi:hypothetical protein
MACTLHLSEDDRAFLCKIIEAISLSQKKLADLSKVTQPWLSQVLTGRREDVDSEMLERVAAQLAERLKNLPSYSTLSEKDVKAAFEFLGRFTKSAATIMEPKFYRPGGAVPMDSAHYIKRSQDREVLAALEELPFTMLVSGPVQCGKSSLLTRLEDKAREKGIETAWFAPQLLPSSLALKTRQPSDVNATAATALSELLQAQWGLERPRDGDFDSIPRLLLWLQKALRPTASKLRLLIIDDLASLGARGAEDWSSLFIRAMHNKISMAVGMTHHFGHNFARRVLLMSSFVHWFPKVEMGWFETENKSTNLSTKADLTEVEKLVQSLADAPPRLSNQEKVTVEVKLVDKLFQGQPYLTHAATIDLAFLKAVQSWTSSSKEKKEEQETKARLVRGAPWYQRHLKSVRSAILSPTLEGDSETRKLLEAFVKICSGQAQPEALFPDHASFLDKAQLIQFGQDDADNKNRTVLPKLEIYRLIAEDLAEFTGN